MADRGGRVIGIVAATGRSRIAQRTGHPSDCEEWLDSSRLASRVYPTATPALKELSDSNLNLNFINAIVCGVVVPP